MPAWPDPFQSLLARTAVRLRALAAANAASVALMISAPALVARLMGVVSTTGCVAIGAAAVGAACAIAAWRSPRRPGALATAIEARTAVAQNLLVTAAELNARSAPIRADVRAVVLSDAAEVAGRIDIASLFPARRAAATLLMASGLWIAGVSLHGTWIARARDFARGGVAGAPAISRIRVTITPPAYSGRPAQAMTDPDRIEALSGSTIHVDVDATAEHVDLIGVGERHALAANRSHSFGGDVTAAADGFLAVQPFGAGDAAGVRRLISLTVVPDHAPVARIVAPGKDLFLSAATATLPVRIEASDDLGLRSLQLTYTKVTGSGENFQFRNGEFPLQISRDRPQAWTATSSIPLAALGLEPGDVLVYRAVIGDTRPGRDAAESDAFVIEIVRPGEALAEGFTIDEDRDKYAISQQMIIIKTERLIAKKAVLAADAFADEAQTIAAEQRKVRAEFVFMVGGEFEDAADVASGDINEEAEAANEAELLAGRMQNNGRRDIIQATRRMSEAAQLLTKIDPVQALPQEKAALDALQRAFTKSRYILRVLTPRERIDDARRLSGKLGDASAWRRVVPDVPDDPRTSALLAALARVGQVASLTTYGTAEANALAGIAEAILGVDGSLTEVARGFMQAGASIAAGKPAAEIAAEIDAAAVKLSLFTRQGLPMAPRSADPSRARLQGALADALKRGGGRP